MYEINATIKGIAPLLQHRFGAAAETEAKSVTKRQAGQLDFSEEWRDTVYADAEGNLYEPATHIEGAMLKAAVLFRIKGRGKKTYKDLVNAAVVINPDRIPLGIMLPDEPTYNPDVPFYIDLRPVKVNRARVMRARGAFAKGWELNFTVTVIDDQLPFDVLKQILDEAGRAIGIGDYRPKFGRFIVTKFELAEN